MAFALPSALSSASMLTLWEDLLQQQFWDQPFVHSMLKVFRLIVQQLPKTKIASHRGMSIRIGEELSFPPNERICVMITLD
jgi:hypothetical protein